MQKTFLVHDRPVGLPGKPLLIAELACAHDGSVEALHQLIDAAAAAKADVVQLQIFRSNRQVPTHHPIRPLLDRIQISDEDWKQLFAHAQTTGLAVSAFVYDVPSLALALDFKPHLLKLNSSDLSHEEMLEGCARTGLPISLGVGGSTLEEVQSALRTLEKVGGEKIILMHGVQNFPTAVADARLTRLRLLGELFKRPIGYGDHTDADLSIAQVIDLVALGAGVAVLEKHLTLSRAAKLADYQASLEPAEFERYVQLMRDAAASLSDPVPIELTEIDRRYRQFQKKYAFAARDLAAGAILSREDVVFLRTAEGVGLSEHEFLALVGKKWVKSVTRETLIEVGHFE